MNQTLPLINGQLDWKAYHAQRAFECRRVAENWRETAKDWEKPHPDFAVIAKMRANENELWAIESEALSKAV